MGTATDKDYFGSFLSGGSRDQDWTRPEPSADMEKQILRLLAVIKDPVPLRELLVRLDLPPSLAVGAITRLRDAALIDGVGGAEGEGEGIVLTELGRSVAPLY